MTGRILATCGWLAWHVGRPFRATPLRRLGSAPVLVVAVLLLAAAAAPIVAPLLDAQPEDVVVQQIFDGTTTHPQGWIRLTGQVVPLSDAPTGERGSFALVVDADNPLRAVVVQADERQGAAERAQLTGHLVPASVVVEEELPISATTAGTPPRVVPDRLVGLDAAPKPVRSMLWFLAIPPALLAAALLVGVRAGYPIFRPTYEIDVLASPLGVGERVPTAYGGRIGPNERPLADPGGALLLVRRGPQGSLLTAQPLADDGGVAPAPVLIGGSWTSGRIGAVHTISETVPALELRSELVNATFLFARNTERDRVAALVAVER
ncbi:MAG: hypothetical protein ACRDFY_03670 [Candidatus Limnocylindria bacterium]